jgi:RNA recognition motif-containing protein
MAAKLYVGGLSIKVGEKELRSLFATKGTVTKCSIEKIEKTNKSKGFGFVEMQSVESAKKAQKELHGTKLDACALVISLING